MRGIMEKVKELLSHYGVVRLSRLLFCSHTSIYFWISGKRNPSVWCKREIDRLHNKLRKEKNERTV